MLQDLEMDGATLPIPKDFNFPKKGCLVADLEAYFPAKTPFLQLAEEQRGLVVLNGLGMLFYQAAVAFELMTSTKFPLKRKYGKP